ncbi:MAG: menaquinone biosynthetic enzyme MqnA/MqnD family protein [Candidatus Eiseniibacteriota bacterium]
MYSKSTTRNATTLALIPYLNCEPFYEGLSELGYDVVREVPRELGRLADAGAATCGPMAVVDWFRLRDRYEPLGDFGIACEGPAHSVLLFARCGIDRLSGCRVGLTGESSTSVRLLEVILRRRYEARHVTLERGDLPNDEARLLIGDSALRAACEGLEGFPFVYDLGEEWHSWQALPFVFARWVVSRDVPEEDRERIRTSLERSLETWEERVPEIAARRGPEFDLDAESIRQYLETFRYRIGPVETFGEQAFEAMLAEEAR